MRLYSFVNYYLSSIQQGIQTAHVVAELSTQPAGSMYSDWAKNHKTIITLNGGNNADLLELQSFLFNYATYPTAAFYEDQQSLGGIVTCVGVILPEPVYVEMELYRKSRYKDQWAEQCLLSDIDKMLVERLAGYSLAR